MIILILILPEPMRLTTSQVSVATTRPTCRVLMPRKKRLPDRHGHVPGLQRNRTSLTAGLLASDSP